MTRDSISVGFALGAGCTADEAASFAIYCQSVQQVGWADRLEIGELFEDWHNLSYVARLAPRPVVLSVRPLERAS